MSEVKLARLISILTHKCSDTFSETEIEEIQNLIKPTYSERTYNPEHGTAIEAMVRFIRHQNKIRAIKEFRVATGASLLESKNAVERMMGE